MPGRNEEMEKRREEKRREERREEKRREEKRREEKRREEKRREEKRREEGRITPCKRSKLEAGPTHLMAVMQLHSAYEPPD
ncbi:hypothetical protein GRJ2_000857700 [Grus japonensis]|uniref:Uncharacterized protein n=1 Tax=Grus japonensis TaxID=30415 RepID=A0ABC9WGH7_GRUJA